MFERDLGSSLLFFAIFLVMLYAATGRAAYVVVGLALFGVGATAAYFLFGHVRTRVDIWLHPFADAAGKGYQLVQSLFALAAGGLTGAGLGMGLPTRIPFVATDFIFSAIGEELGLLGGAAVIICFLIFSMRGLATASRAKTDMAAFTAVGLVAAIALQAFVIVGGVTRLIPLTGVTLPFVSYGGSSLLSSFIALALLLRAGDEGTGIETEMQLTSTDLGVLGQARAGPAAHRRHDRDRRCSWRRSSSTSRGSRSSTRASLQNNAANTRNLAAEARSDRGAILTRDGVVLAQSEPLGNGTYKRVYPKGSFAAHTVGYFSPRYGRAGIEAAENDVLAGGQRAFSTWSDVVRRRGGPLGPRQRRPAHHRQPRPGRGGQGARRAQGRRASCSTRAPAPCSRWPPTPASTPTTSTPTGRSSKRPAPDAPLIDRARSALYAPGSTFKVVTLTGALANGVATPETVLPGPGSMEIGNAPVTNFEGGSYDQIDLVSATMKSVNTVFAQLAVKMGAPALVKQADQFGFDTKVPYELPRKTSLMPDPAEMTDVGDRVGRRRPAGRRARKPRRPAVDRAADGARRGGDRQRRRRHGAVRGRRGARPGGPDPRGARPKTFTTATDPATAEQVIGDHAEGRQRRLGGARADRRRRGGWQDRNRRGRQGQAHQRVVHRLRPRREPHGRAWRS